jgi:ABC-type branched-subunit amino acid transport system permease subunit
MKRALWIGLFAVAGGPAASSRPARLLDPGAHAHLLFAAMAQAWNIVGGLANQISLGHAAFFGVGAYASTILLVTYGLTPWIGLVVGAALAAVAALVIAVPTMRLQGHYFALATLAFGEVMRVVANTWASLTGGPVGISVPFLPPNALMYSFKTGLPHAYIALAALALVTLLFEGLRRSALGYRLRAIREHEPAAEVIGIDTTRVKLIATVISGRRHGGARHGLRAARPVLRSGHHLRRCADLHTGRPDRHRRRHRHRRRADPRCAPHHPRRRARQRRPVREGAGACRSSSTGWCSSP